MLDQFFANIINSLISSLIFTGIQKGGEYFIGKLIQNANGITIKPKALEFKGINLSEDL